MKIITVVLALMLFGTSIFLFGLFIGFERGAYSSLAIDAPHRAIVTIGELKMLDDNQDEELRGMLEHSIDVAIVNYGNYINSGYRKYVFNSDLKQAQLLSEQHMQTIAAYRSKYPSTSEDKKIRKLIAMTLSNYKL